MQRSLTRRRAKQRRGALTLEWILIITVLVIGVIGGLGLVRNAIIQQMADMADSIQDLQVTPQSQFDIDAQNAPPPSNIANP
jgi:hypothetical protein